MPTTTNHTSGALTKDPSHTLEETSKRMPRTASCAARSIANGDVLQHMSSAAPQAISDQRISFHVESLENK